MFTGIVEAIGEISDVSVRTDAAELTIRTPWSAGEVTPGDSFAVDGVCLTARETRAASEGAILVADVMAETLHRSTLGSLKVNQKVNLELALQVGGRFGGHIVQGHVDATAEVLRREPFEHWETVTISLPMALAPYVVEKGSIAVDGISLTVSRLDDHSFDVSLIPTTLENTTLGKKTPGEYVNLEADVIAKYVEKLVRH